MQTSIAILGAGAMGLVFAARLQTVAKVALVAEGERRQRLLNGVTINDQHYDFPVKTGDDTSPPDDLVLVALKHQHPADAIPLIRNRVGENTVIISVMNGLDSEPMLAEAYGADNVLYAISVGLDAQRKGTDVYHSKIGVLHFGEADNSTLSDKVKWTQSLLAAADIPYQTPTDMIRTMWWKFMINVGINQTSSLLDAPYGVFQTSPHAQAIMEAAMQEVVTIAQAERVNLTEADITGWYDILATVHPEGRTSMLQDVNAGRMTEVDIFAGKMIELGQKHGIDVPVNQLLFHAIKTIESRYAE